MPSPTGPATRICPAATAAGLAGQLRGLAHVHAGWLLCDGPTSPARYTPDTLADPAMRAILAALSLALPFGAGWLPARPRPAGRGDSRPARCRPDRRRNRPGQCSAPRQPDSASCCAASPSRSAPAARCSARSPPPAVLLAARGWRITAPTAASNLAWWLVLLACLRGVGLSQAQAPWQTSLAAFAFARHRPATAHAVMR